MLVERRADSQVGYGAQGCQVEGAVVGGAVLAHQSGSVETEHHVEVEQRHVVYDIVVGSLGKGTVDVAEGQQPVLGHASGEGDGVSLGDAHVEGSLGHLLHHDVHRAAGGHGWRHTNDFRILFGQFEQRMSEHVLILLWFVGVAVYDALSGLGVELPRCVPGGHVALCRRIAVPLLGVQVQQLWPLHFLYLLEDAHQFLHVVAVEGPEVAYVQPLEDVLLLRDGTLQGVRQAYDALATVVREHALAVEPPRSLETQGVVGLVGAQVEQVLLHAAHRAVDRHVVVVEDDEQVVGTLRHVVQPLEGQSAAHGPVADDGHHLAPAALGIGGYSHAQRCRHRVGGMAAGKGVVLALQGRWEGPDAAQLAVGAELVSPPCEYLMAVGLMAHVPYDAVFGGVVNIM